MDKPAWVFLALGGAALLLVMANPGLITPAKPATAQPRIMEPPVYSAPGSSITKVCGATTYVQATDGTWSVQCHAGQVCSHAVLAQAPC